MDKKKAMLSQPMRGKTDEEIIETRNRAIKALEAAGYEVVNTPFTDEWYSKEKMEERGIDIAELEADSFLRNLSRTCLFAMRSIFVKDGIGQEDVFLKMKLQKHMGLISFMKSR